MLIFFGLVVLVFLCFMSAYWSAAETALTSLSKYRVKKLIALNKSISSLLGQWLKTPYYLLTTILVGNTTNDLMLSSIATIIILHMAEPFFGIIPRGVFEVADWVFVTVFLLLVGEITPKLYARRNPEKVTMLLLPSLTRIMHISSYLVLPFTKTMRLLFPRLNLVPVGRLSGITLEEIHGLIGEANSTGAIGKDTSQMLERVLKLGELTVSHIMTPVKDVDAVNLYQPEDKFFDLVVETARSRVPVYNSNINKIAGFIHSKDILWCWKKNKECFSREIIRPPYFVKSDKKVYDLLKEFQTGKTHMAFVVDGIGNVTGIVTLEDVLEDIVGEILDEYDVRRDKE